MDSVEENITSEDYIRMIFDTNRLGFREIAYKLLIEYLDYKSFIQLKRSCKFIYEYMRKECSWEQLKFEEKLSHDWSKNDKPQIRTFKTPPKIVCAKVFDDCNQVAVASKDNLWVFPMTAAAGSDLISKCEAHQADITCLDVIPWQDTFVLASGSQDGVLILSDSKNGTVLSQKQLFGRLSVIRFRGDFLVTAHFGKPHDVGSISVRRFDSPQETPVVFSMFGELFPVFHMDFNSKYLAVLEWSGTFHNVHVGNINLYNFLSNECLQNLSYESKKTFSTFRLYQEDQDHFLFTGGEDKCFRIWKIKDQFAECLMTLNINQGKISIMDINLSRIMISDNLGNTLILNAKAMLRDLASNETDNWSDWEKYVVNRFNTKMVQIEEEILFQRWSGVCFSERNLVFSSTKFVMAVYDFWC